MGRGQGFSINEGGRSKKFLSVPASDTLGESLRRRRAATDGSVINREGVHQADDVLREDVEQALASVGSLHRPRRTEVVPLLGVTARTLQVQRSDLELY